MTRYLYDPLWPTGLNAERQLIPMRRVQVSPYVRLGGFGADEDEGSTSVPAPVFAWPIQPAPKSTPGQLFTAKLPSGKPHNALDMGTGGNAVFAAAAGAVTVSVASGDARGSIIHLDHGDTWSTRYYHLDQRFVKKGDIVSAGQQIGIAGRTGLPKNNPHLHFMVYWGSTPIDPQLVLPPREGESTKTIEEFYADVMSFLTDTDPGTDVGGGGMGGVLAVAGLAWLVLR
jgi:murein DD-endopeptidase MepM/ murein hydrolase activator NlpD